MIPFLVVLVLFLLIDLPVILYFNNQMYSDQFKRINGLSQPQNSHAILSGIFAYFLLALGIYFFIVKTEINNPNYYDIFIKGLILGLVVYGVYNGTNMATIAKWGLHEFIVDTLWGTFLSGTLAVSSVYILQSLGY